MAQTETNNTTDKAKAALVAKGQTIVTNLAKRFATIRGEYLLPLAAIIGRLRIAHQDLAGTGLSYRADVGKVFRSVLPEAVRSGKEANIKQECVNLDAKTGSTDAMEAFNLYNTIRGAVQYHVNQWMASDEGKAEAEKAGLSEPEKAAPTGLSMTQKKEAATKTLFGGDSPLTIVTSRVPTRGGKDQKASVRSSAYDNLLVTTMAETGHGFHQAAATTVLEAANGLLAVVNQRRVDGETRGAVTATLSQVDEVLDSVRRTMQEHKQATETGVQEITPPAEKVAEPAAKVSATPRKRAASK